MQTLTFGGVSPWLMREYMTRLGATRVDDGANSEDTYTLRGATVRFGYSEPVRIASVEIAQLRITVEGEDEELEHSVAAAIRLKAMRGGG
ncbi:MAG: DUF1952 domain-containing protein [Trueperaceae bacterium]|nr:DUF1952 domain-containing protein [Trueperaceae bacterium]